MDKVRSFRRKKTLKQVQSTVGTRKGRGSRSMALRPKDDAAAHEVMAADASPNLRVWQMFDEASDFDDRLHGARGLLAEFEHATDEFLLKLEPILRTPLPRVWDAVEGGLAEPTRATVSHHHAHTVGGDVSIAGLEEARSEFHNRLRGHVIRPLEQWSEGLSAVEGRLPELVRLRGKVVKESRNLARYNSKYQRSRGEEGAIVPVGGQQHRAGGGGVKGLFGACTRPRAGHGGIARRRDDDASSLSSDDEVDDEIAHQVASEEAGMRLNYKHRQLDAARGDYMELEQLVAGQLAGLARDAAWLKSYLVAALLLGKEAMQMGVVSLATTKQPLPGFTGRVAPPAVHGEMGHNYELAAAMPPALPPAPPGAAAWGMRLLPSLLDTGVPAHKATASPLELSAVPDAQPLQPVTPVPTGAAGVPLSAVKGYEGVGGVTGGELIPQQGVSGTAGRDELRQHHMRYDTNVGSAGSGSYGLQGQQYSGQSYGSMGGRDESAALRYAERERDVSGREHDGAGRGGITGAIAHAAERVAETVGLTGSHSHRSDRSAEHATQDGDTYGRDVNDSGRRDQYRGQVSSSGGYYGTSSKPAGYQQGSTLRSDLNPEVCGRKEFTVVEDRAVLKERVTKVLEHHPVEKQYETAVKYAGESQLPASAEAVGTPETRVVHAAAPTPPRPTETQTFTEVEDRPVLKERVTKELEHRPVERQYETAVKYAGETQLPGSIEAVGGPESRVVHSTPAAPPRPTETQTFTEVEDRPVLKERVTKELEHRPVEKQYEAAVKYAGETPLPGSVEAVGTPESRIVHSTPPGPKCPEGVCV